jgi:hypothetical protein
MHEFLEAGATGCLLCNGAYVVMFLIDWWKGKFSGKEE